MGLYTLRFTNRAAAEAAAKALGFWDSAEDRLSTSGQRHSISGSWYGWHIDEIGQNPVIKSAEYNARGVQTQPPVYATGFFVNITGQLPPQAEPYVVAYGSGGRIFAGTTPEVSP